MIGACSAMLLLKIFYRTEWKEFLWENGHYIKTQIFVFVRCQLEAYYSTPAKTFDVLERKVKG